MAAAEVERVRGKRQRKEIDLQEQTNFFQNEVGNNQELRKNIRESEKKAQTMKERLTLCEEEKRTYENEVSLSKTIFLPIISTYLLFAVKPPQIMLSLNSTR